MKSTLSAIVAAAVLPAAVALVTLGGITAAHAERPNGGRHHQPNLSSSPVDPDTVPGLSTARAEADVLAVASYLHDLDVQAAVSYVAAVQDAEVRAYADAVARSRPQVQYAPRVSSVTGDCYGSQVPDYIVNRESGGNPGAYNPSGAWGCFQIMPGTWAGAGCNQFGAYGSASADAQKQCADIIWNGGAGASNWVTA